MAEFCSKLPRSASAVLLKKWDRKRPLTFQVNGQDCVHFSDLPAVKAAKQPAAGKFAGIAARRRKEGSPLRHFGFMVLCRFYKSRILPLGKWILVPDKLNINISIVVFHIQYLAATALIRRQGAFSLFNLGKNREFIIAADNSSADISVFTCQC